VRGICDGTSFSSKLSLFLNASRPRAGVDDRSKAGGRRPFGHLEQFVQDGRWPGNADIYWRADLELAFAGRRQNRLASVSPEIGTNAPPNKPRPTAAEETRGEGVQRAIRPLLVDLNRVEDFSPGRRQGDFSGPAIECGLTCRVKDDAPGSPGSSVGLKPHFLGRPAPQRQRPIRPSVGDCAEIAPIAARAALRPGHATAGGNCIDRHERSGSRAAVWLGEALTHQRRTCRGDCDAPQG
jgi:hypothetical protein